MKNKDYCKINLSTEQEMKPKLEKKAGNLLVISYRLFWIKKT
jgi:hypothetical protein